MCRLCPDACLVFMKYTNNLCEMFFGQDIHLKAEVQLVFETANWFPSRMHGMVHLFLRPEKDATAALGTVLYPFLHTANDAVYGRSVILFHSLFQDTRVQAVSECLIPITALMSITEIQEARAGPPRRVKEEDFRLKFSHQLLEGSRARGNAHACVLQH
eukprot:scaffold191672_cov17-Tisochrysis_lutea.AAC.1